MSEPSSRATPSPMSPDRLDSWKEIAAYLDRDVTTVQRWERREGMPVHRHLHDKIGSVYASRSELDSWARTRKPRPQTEGGMDVPEADSRPAALPPAAASGDTPPGPGVRVFSAILMAAAVIVLAFLWMGGRYEPASFRSLAVLPFRSVSDSGDGPLADGITEALIIKLTNLKGLRVVSYSSVRRFKESSEEARAIGRALGVEAVIEGSVRAVSGRFRISAQGVDTASGYVIWATGPFEATSETLPEVERRLAEDVAQRVRGALTAAERRMAGGARTANGKAYYLILKARGAEPESAVRMLREAVQIDPGYADAYGWLALAHRRIYAKTASRQSLRDAISSANQALSRDPSSPPAIRALVGIQHLTGREIEALILAGRALENDPENPDALAAAGEAYFRTGLYERAIPLYEKALAADPSNREYRGQLARMHLFLGQLESGMEVISRPPVADFCCFPMLLYAAAGQTAKAVEIARNREFRAPYAFEAYLRGYVMESAGDRAAAQAIWSEGLRRTMASRAPDENPEARMVVGMIHAKLGQKEEALTCNRRALESDPLNPVILFFSAQTHSLLGMRRQALQDLKGAVENGFLNLPLIEYHTRPGLSFHAIRNEPAFHAIRADLARRIASLRARY